MDEPRKRIFNQSTSSTSAYSRHLQQVDAYVRYYGGEKPTLSRARTEREILEDNHRFLRDEGQEDSSIDRDQEKELARRYYDSLFREFSLIDLSRWREKQVAMRWRTKGEVLSGKGQFACASLHCSNGGDGVVGVTNGDEVGELRTFELNFGYAEEGVKKNALVKVRVCRKCTKKLSSAQRTDEGEQRRHRYRSRNERDSTSLLQNNEGHNEVEQRSLGPHTKHRPRSRSRSPKKDSK